MSNYSRYKTDTLKAMLEKAKETYRKETEKPGPGWGAGMRMSKLPDFKAWDRARERVEAIESELRKREMS